jgi:hypothetical protein
VSQDHELHEGLPDEDHGHLHGVELQGVELQSVELESVELQSARAVADAVMYEGYLLYPYRASAAKNQIRWQFGVLGPQGAAAAGVGEEPDLVTEILVRHGPAASVAVHLRFLQLQSRTVESLDAAGVFATVDELQVEDQRWLGWDEAIEAEVVVATVPLGVTGLDEQVPVFVEGAAGETTLLRDHDGRLVGRLVRSRQPLSATVGLRVSQLAGEPDVSRLQVRVDNLARLTLPTREEALGLSFLGAHLLLTCESGEFISLVDPPARLLAAAQECQQYRCWPVLAGPAGSSGVLLVSPIILEDHPSLAEESAGALFDSTEIDEILTLRILTMTEEEKAEARATDPRAAQIIDRSEGLSDDEMARLHGALRNPHALGDPMSTWDSLPVHLAPDHLAPDHVLPDHELPDHVLPDHGLSQPTMPNPGSEVPWWDPEQDASVNPGTDTVIIAGQVVNRGSLVRIHPNRRADAQDLFFADQTARVTGVHFDVDGATHVGVVLVNDPAADLHDWYGRYLYFDPGELEPVDSMAAESMAAEEAVASNQRREARS